MESRLYNLKIRFANFLQDLSDLLGKIKAKSFVAHGNINLPLLITVLIMSVAGFFCLFSVSISSGGSVIGKQALLLVGGIIVMLIVSHIDVSFFKESIIVYGFYFVSVVLMAICLVVNRGSTIKRSMPIFGFSFEPSELLKFAVILFIVYYSQIHADELKLEGLKPVEYGRTKHSRKWLRRAHKMNLSKPFLAYQRFSQEGDLFFDDSFWCHFKLAAGVAVPLVLIALSSHLSAMIIYSVVSLYLLFYCGAKPKYLKAGVIAAIFGLILYINFVMGDYQKERIFNWHYEPDQKTQSSNALYAICSGGLTGKGFLNSTEKFGYVAEAKNDFIFSIFCEEFGFVGAAGLITGFSLLVMIIYKLGKKADGVFEMTTVKAIAVMIATQVFFHIGVNASILPNTGITLPFFSSGGSALLVYCIEMGYVLSISRTEARTALSSYSKYRRT